MGLVALSTKVARRGLRSPPVGTVGLVAHASPVPPVAVVEPPVGGLSRRLVFRVVGPPVIGLVGRPEVSGRVERFLGRLTGAGVVVRLTSLSHSGRTGRRRRRRRRTGRGRSSRTRRHGSGCSTRRPTTEGVGRKGGGSGRRQSRRPTYRHGFCPSRRCGRTSSCSARRCTFGHSSSGAPSSDGSTRTETLLGEVVGLRGSFVVCPGRLCPTWVSPIRVLFILSTKVFVCD